MELGFTFGANLPTAVFALHAAVATVFLTLGAVNAGAGELIGFLLNSVVGALLVAAGVVTARITRRRL